MEDSYIEYYGFLIIYVRPLVDEGKREFIMSILKSIRELDQKFSWSFFGFLLAIALGVVTLYDRVLADKHAQLYLDVLTSTAVLDIREQLPNLKISYDGIDIREKDLSLQILTIKAVNDSTRDILKGHYDSDDPVGLKVTSGKVIRTELVEASSDYLSRNVSFDNPTNNVIHFKDVILDAHEFFVLKLLVLHPASEDVSIKPVGHISGMQSIIIREHFKEVGRPGFWIRTFTGALGVQLVRLVAYTLLTILIILLIVIPTALIGDKVQELKRRRHVRDFKAATQLDLTENDEFLFGRYVIFGVQEVLALQDLSKSKKALLRAYSRYERMGKKAAKPMEVPDEFHIVYPSAFYPGGVSHLGLYIEAGFIHVEDGKPTVDEHMSQTVEHFIRFLRNRQIIKEENETEKQARHAMPAGVLELSDEEEEPAAEQPPERDK